MEISTHLTLEVSKCGFIELGAWLYENLPARVLFAALVTLLAKGDSESALVMTDVTVLLVRCSEVKLSVSVDDDSLVFVVDSAVTGIFVACTVVVGVAGLSVVAGGDATASKRQQMNESNSAQYQLFELHVLFQC